MKTGCIARCRIAAGILLLTAAAVAQKIDMDMEISGFRVPDYDRDGNKTSQLFGDRAEVEPGGEVKITGMRIEFYKLNETFMTVTAPYCFYNQTDRRAHSDAPVAADMERMTMRGKGFVLDSGVTTVRVLDESSVVISDIMKQVDAQDGSGRAPLDVTRITSKEMLLNYKQKNVIFEQTVHVSDPQLDMDCETLEIRLNAENEIDTIEAHGGVTMRHERRNDSGQFLPAGLDAKPVPENPSVTNTIVLTADELFLDYQKKTARFSGAVHVSDPRLEMDCQALTVRFSEKNEIDWIEATGSVRLVSEGREAQAEKATYQLETDEFVLEGNPKILVGPNVLYGTTIRFWRGSERMVCEPAARLVIYPDDKLKINLFEN